MEKLLINSLPKSGTNMVSKLANLMNLSYTNIGIASSSVLGKYSVLKSLIRGPFFCPAIIRVGVDTSACVRESWITQTFSKIKSGSYATGHTPYSDQLMNLLTDLRIRVIQVVRDPRDVLVSWSHYVASQPWHFAYAAYADRSFEDCCRFTLYGGRVGKIYIEGFTSILRAVEGWLLNPKVLVIHYENLVGESGGGSRKAQSDTIRQFAEFVGCKSVQIDTCADALYGGTPTFRKGKIGSWKSELGTELLDEIETVFSDYLIKFGYK